MLRRYGWIAMLAALGAGLAFASACSESIGASAGREAGAASIESALLSSCDVTNSTCTNPAPHYADITGILGKGCNPCHTGIGSAPWPLTTYDDVAAWADLIQLDLSKCTMPPLDGGVAMSAAERLKVLNWVQCGALP